MCNMSMFWIFTNNSESNFIGISVEKIGYTCENIQQSVTVIFSMRCNIEKDENSRHSLKVPRTLKWKLSLQENDSCCIFSTRGCLLQPQCSSFKSCYVHGFYRLFPKMSHTTWTGFTIELVLSTSMLMFSNVNRLKTPTNRKITRSS